MYRPRDAEHTVLHQVVSEHLEAFLRAAAEATDGAGLPQFVEREFREFLLCGVFDVQACPACGGRLRLIAIILDPRTIRAMLLALGLSTDVADRAPPAHSARAAAEGVPGVPA